MVAVLPQMPSPRLHSMVTSPLILCHQGRATICIRGTTFRPMLRGRRFVFDARSIGVGFPLMGLKPCGFQWVATRSTLNDAPGEYSEYVILSMRRKSCPSQALPSPWVSWAPVHLADPKCDGHLQFPFGTQLLSVELVDCVGLN